MGQRWDCRRQILVVLALFCIALSTPGKTLADTIETVSIDTTALKGTAAQIAFDFTQGGPPNSNAVVLSNFLSDGTLGSVTPTGSVSGSFPGTVTLTDSTFFNEYLTNFTFGTSFSFRLDATNNGPGLGNTPDGFSLTIVDPNTNLALFGTSDPTGAGSLLLLSIDGSTSGALSVYAAPQAQVSVTAPEPDTLLLTGSGVMAFLVLFFWKKRSTALARA